MSRGFVPALYACALILALCPVSAFAQTSGTVQTGPSAAEDNEARELFKIGKEAFDEGRFERALKYFQDAYDLSHRPALLSNIGTALDRLRRDQEAVDTYHKYLEQMPEAPNRALIEERIRIIETALARAQTTPPPTAAGTVPPLSAAGSAQLSEAPAPVQAPTPQQTALAAHSSQADTNAAQHLTDSGPAPITSRWWFWTGVGAVAVAAVVVVVAVSAGGGNSAANNTRKPTLLDPMTRVREL